jgi:hypothetical protein
LIAAWIKSGGSLPRILATDTRTRLSRILACQLRSTSTTHTTSSMVIRYPAALGDPRRPRSDRHQIWLRHSPVRCMHGTRRRDSAAVMLSACRRNGRAQHHDHRGSFVAGGQGSAEGMDRT